MARRLPTGAGRPSCRPGARARSSGACPPCSGSARDRPEPAHIHVERDAFRAKFWLGPVRLADSGGFHGPELARLAALGAEHEVTLRSAWDEYFHD